MQIKKIFNVVLGLSTLIMGYTAYAAPVTTYQATVIADCSKLGNCPLRRGDILWNNDSSRSGLPLNNGMLFLGVDTRAKIINLTRNLQEFYLIKGTLSLRVWETRPRQVYQIQAGNLTVSIRRSGYYRIDVSPNGRETMIRVVEGRAEIRIGNLVKVIRKGETFRSIRLGTT